jgi:hypothetical protein
VASGGGGQWLMAREGGRDTGDRWGEVDGARRWLEEAGASDTIMADRRRVMSYPVLRWQKRSLRTCSQDV